MKANKLSKEEVVAFIESNEGKAFLDELDSHWGEVMEPARKHGFIVQAFGGTATLATYGTMLEEVGVDGAVRMLQMSGIELPEVTE